MRSFIVCIALLLCSCAGLPTISSISETDQKAEGYRFYDADSKIRYQVTHTDQALHIKLNTTDRMSIRKILDFGLHVYFDPAGKKNKKTYIHYPLAGDKEEFSNPPAFGLNQNGNMNLKSQIANVPHEYLFKQEGKEEQLLQAMLNTGIQLAMIANTDNELTYDLRIPFEKIGQSDLSNLSIGIVSGSIERAESDTPPPQQQNNNRPGSQMGGNVGQMRARTSPMERPIEIWFQLAM